MTYNILAIENNTLCQMWQAESDVEAINTAIDYAITTLQNVVESEDIDDPTVDIAAYRDHILSSLDDTNQKYTTPGIEVSIAYKPDHDPNTLLIIKDVMSEVTVTVTKTQTVQAGSRQGIGISAPQK